MKKTIPNQEMLNAMGGGDAIISMFKKKGLFEFIDNQLGSRSPRAEYKYSEAIIAWFITMCSGGTRLEHMNNYRIHLANHPALQKAMSPDTMSKIIDELSTPNSFYDKVVKKPKKPVTSSYLPNEVNANQKLNRLMISMSIELGLLIPGVRYILDYDTTQVPTKIKGGRHLYKTNERGYQPALASINHIPIYLENRNGDSSPKFKLVDTIMDAIDLLHQYGIVIDTVRVDAAAYMGEFVRTMGHNKIRFVTRPRASVVKEGHKFTYDWEMSSRHKIHLGAFQYNWCGVEGRVIIEGRNQCEYGVYTNDLTTPKPEIVQLYRDRGDVCENVFRDLKSHFGWDIMAKRKLNCNTTYLGIQLLCYILFKFLKRKLSRVLKFVKENMQLKTFITAFMRVVTKWVGDTLKFVGTRRDYKPLAGFI